MAKCQISNGEYELLSSHFKAPKAGEHVLWREFSDRVDEVFTQKGLEKKLDVDLDAVNTTTKYGRTEAGDETR
jgi:hypothetical protein